MGGGGWRQLRPDSADSLGTQAVSPEGWDHGREEEGRQRHWLWGWESPAAFVLLRQGARGGSVLAG